MSDLDRLAAATPATRDRYVDFLRAVSILVVVFGHWLIGQIYWEGGVIGTTSAIGVTSWAWLATWVLQVMPLFFFVGGFSNLVSYRSLRGRGGTTFEFLRSRLARLLRPSLVFVAVWGLIQVVLHLTDTGTKTTSFLRGMRPPGATVPFGPLWFLAVYAAIIVVSPLMIRLHERFGLAVPVAMSIGAIAADAVGFIGGRHGVRWANVGLVFLLPHQLGFFYADGGLARMSRRALAAMALAGLVAMLVLTTPYVFGEAGDRWFSGIGHYPKSLLGNDRDPVSNTYPPTIVMLAMAFWSIGAAMLLRDRANAWLQRAGPWRFTIFTNGVIMTLFLWHMTAFLLSILVLWPLGLGRLDATHLRYWLERPLWLGLSAVFLAGLIAAFGRFERPRARAPDAQLRRVAPGKSAR